MKVFVVINPHAKRNKKRPELPAKLQSILGPTAEIRLSQTLDRVDHVAHEALAADCEVLAICGGDGTIHHTLTRFARVYGAKPLPKLLTLGGGTMNMICHSVQVLGPAEGIAHRFKQISAKPHLMQTVARNTLAVEGRLSFIFGFGLVSNFLDAYYEGGNTGPIKAAMVAQRGVRSVIERSEFARQLFSPWSGSVAVDGRDLGFAHFTAVLVQTIENLGIGFKPMYRAFEKPRHFHVIASQMSPVKLVNHLPDIFFGRPMHHPDTFDAAAQELVAKPAGSTLYTMDGDMYTSDKELRVSMGPEVQIIKV